MRRTFLGARLVGLRRGGPVVWWCGRGAAAMAMVFIIDGILERNEKLASLHSSLVCCQCSG